MSARHAEVSRRSPRETETFHSATPPGRNGLTQWPGHADKYIQVGSQKAVRRRGFAGEECGLGGSR